MRVHSAMPCLTRCDHSRAKHAKLRLTDKYCHHTNQKNLLALCSQAQHSQRSWLKHQQVKPALTS